MISGDLTQKIRQRAYEIWEREGRPHGRDRIHWLRAEAEMRDARPPVQAPDATKQKPKTRGKTQPAA
jgi:hypothetical protein